MTKPAQSVEFREPEWLARMETALEVLNDEVVIADDRPRILFANSRFVEMIGIPAMELIGFDLWFAKTLADFEINEIAALPLLFCYNS